MTRDLDPRITITPVGSLGNVTPESLYWSNGSVSGSYFPMDDSAYSEPQEDSNVNYPIRKHREAKPDVTAEFYFNKVKQGMTQIQQDELLSRVTNLTAVLDMAPREQLVLREETQRLLAVAFLQQKAAVLGYDCVVTQDTINQFRDQVEMRRPELMELRSFPRLLPKEALEELRRAQEAGIFDEFHVLTWNPRQEQVAAVTDRIIKKDPILFGRFAFDPFYHFYITSWIDETCDLTFEGMVAAIKELHPDYEPERVVPLKASDADYLIKMAVARAGLLAKTSSRRYRSDALILELANENFSWATVRALAKALFRQYFRRKARISVCSRSR